MSLQVIVPMCVLRELLGQASTAPSSAWVGRDRSCSCVLGLQESLGLPGVALSPHSQRPYPAEMAPWLVKRLLAGQELPAKKHGYRKDVPSGESERQFSVLSQCGNGLYEQREKKDRWHQSD